MAEIEKRCGTCKHFTNETATGEGICEAPLPYFMAPFWSKEGLVVECSDGSDCNAWQEDIHDSQKGETNDTN